MTHADTQLGNQKIFRLALDCTICGGPGQSAFTVRTINPEKSEEVEVRKCGKCGHRWINPMPRQGYLDYLYSVGSFDVVGVGWEQSLKHKRLSRAEELVITYLKKMISGGESVRYLEVGTGAGMLFHEVYRRGFECYGVEPGRWDLGENVYKDLDAIPVKEGFGILVCLDVLEHMEDPVGFLGRLRNYAAPSAMLFCHFPNADSVEARIRKKHWPMLRPFGHLHFFSRESAKCMLNTSSWQVVRLRAKGTIRLRDAFPKPKPLIRYSVEGLGFGDQWFVVARPL